MKWPFNGNRGAVTAPSGQTGVNVGNLPPSTSEYISEEMIVPGRTYWNSLHSLAASYIPEMSRMAKDVIEGGLAKFPCGKCRMHGQDYIAKMPPDYSSRMGLARWAWEYHNYVNAKLGKPVYPWEAVEIAPLPSSSSPSPPYAYDFRGAAVPASSIPEFGSVSREISMATAKYSSGDYGGGRDGPIEGRGGTLVAPSQFVPGGAPSSQGNPQTAPIKFIPG